MYRKYRYENGVLLEIAALKQFVQTYFGRSFSCFRHFWEGFDIFISNCLFFEV